MKNYFFLFRTISFLFFLCFFNTCVLFAGLLEDKDLDPRNYTTVRLWNDALKGGRNFGHASLEIIANNVSTLYVSLHPAEQTAEALVGKVPAKWNTLAEDNKEGNAATILWLFSLNHRSMKREFETCKSNIKYVLSGNGNDSIYIDDDTVRNCACMVRDLLNAGGMGEFFKGNANSALSVPRILPASIEIVAGALLGQAGVLLGGGFGLLRGVLTWNSPLDKAMHDARKAGFFTSMFFYDRAARHFSMINYGHTCGECSIVYPGDILKIVRDARDMEKIRCPKSKLWKDMERSSNTGQNTSSCLIL